MQADDVVAAVEEFNETLAHPSAMTMRGPRITAALGLDVPRNVDPLRTGITNHRFEERHRDPFGYRRFHGLGSQRPLHHQPVGLVSRIGTVVNSPVAIWPIPGHGRPEPAEVEVRVSADQRVERPPDDADTTVQRPLPLIPLHRKSDAPVVVFRHHSGQVGVQKH
jgi:hypothetical protein